MSSYPIAHKFPDFVIVDPPLHELLIDSSFPTLKETLFVRGETPLSVLPRFEGLQRKPVDGVNERAIERQSPGKLSGGLLISLLRSGYRALKSSQSIVKLWNC